MKKHLETIKIVLACVLTVILAFGVGIQFERLPEVRAQNTGYRYAGNDIIFSGPGGGICWEPSFNAGPDSCLQRITAQNTGFTNGNGAIGVGNTGWASVPPPPVVGLATATTGGTIPDGTSYRFDTRYITIEGGSTNVTSTQEATQTTSGGGLSTITVTAPIAAAGAAGYTVDASNASGVGNGNATLTELSQPLNTAVCAGAFQVNGPGGAGTGPWACPFGTNAVFTSLLFTAATNVVPNTPGTTSAFPNGGFPVPLQNTAAYPGAVPDLIANLVQMPTLSTITTAQTFATIPLSPNVQNQVGKTLHVTGHGRYTSGAQSGTMTIALTEGGITPITVVAGPLVTGGQTNAQFEFDYYITTNKAGATGTVWGHGQLRVNLATASNTSALSPFNDTLTAVSSAINLTAANSLAITIAMSSSTTSATLDDAQVWLCN